MPWSQRPRNHSCAEDLGASMGGEVYVDSSAALGISQRCGIGKVRHLRRQGLWVQEARHTGRLAYRKVLGTKNPADVLTSTSPRSCCRGTSRPSAPRSEEAVLRQRRSSIALSPSCSSGKNRKE